MIIPAGISQQKKPHENPTFFWCQTQQPDLGSGQEWHQLGIELHLGTRIKPCTWCVYFTIIHIYMVWYVNILHTIKIHITFVSTIYSFIDLLDIIWQGKTHVNTAIASPETPCGVCFLMSSCHSRWHMRTMMFFADLNFWEDEFNTPHTPWQWKTLQFYLIKSNYI